MEFYCAYVTKNRLYDKTFPGVPSSYVKIERLYEKTTVSQVPPWIAFRTSLIGFIANIDSLWPSYLQMLDNRGITPNNTFSPHHKNSVKREIIELAKTWPLYFAAIFPVTVSSTDSLCIIVFQGHCIYSLWIGLVFVDILVVLTGFVWW